MARKKAIPQETQERAQEKVREALALLEEGVGAILDGESFARYLRCLSRFHQYSVSNVGLILMQRPAATRVAGYKAWQSLGRQVRKGEKGIAILVPFVSRVREGEAGDAAHNPHNPQNPAESAAGGLGKGDTIRVVSRFGVGHVFDIAQTDGEPLPEPPAARAITEATDKGAALWDALAAWLHDEGVAVAIEDCGGSNGYYSPSHKRIVIHERLIGTDQATKTLAHEAAHHVAAHHGALDRRDAETVAESAAFVVLHHFGLDTSDYTFPYVAGWAEERTVLKRNIEAISHIAGRFLSHIGGVRR
jgi:antirestriction protein ArdC